MEARIWRNGEPCVVVIAPLKNNLAVFKQLNINLLFNPEIPLLPIYPRGMKTRPHKNMHTNIHSSIIHDGQKVEITQVPIN